MKWKIVIGLIIVAGIVAVGVLGAHGHVQTVSTNNGGNTYEGPHPHLPGAWNILGSGYSTYEGPHPHLPGAW